MGTPVDSTKTFASGQADRITRTPFPNSQKVYVEGSEPGVRVAMREIALSPTSVGQNGNSQEVPNAPLTVYDTSGPYSDPDVDIDLRKGLAPLRLDWIHAREDVDVLSEISSTYGRTRENSAELEGVRFSRERPALRAKQGACVRGPIPIMNWWAVSTRSYRTKTNLTQFIE